MLYFLVMNNKEYHIKYYQDNKEKLKAKQNQYYIDNKEGCWNIDHITPFLKIDLTIKEEFLKTCHYANLQPLWFLDNIKKANKI